MACLCLACLTIMGCNLATWIEAGLAAVPPAPTSSPLPPTIVPRPVMPTETATLPPPPTETPTPLPQMGRLEGQLEEGEVDSEKGRPPLVDALVVLCPMVSEKACVISPSLSARTDLDQTFVIDPLEPGDYVVLFNPFPIDDLDAYWEYWDGRQINFTHADSTLLSLGEGIEIYLSSAPEGGVTDPEEGAEGSRMILADTAIWYKDLPLVIEFVAEQTPVIVSIAGGETTLLTLVTHIAFPE